MIYTIADDPGTLAAALADRLVLEARAAWAGGHILRIALSGGQTPARLYEELRRLGNAVPWPALEIFFSDERAVPPDHPDSNYGLAHRLWLGSAPPGAVIHRIHGEEGADAAARQYRDLLDRATRGGLALDIVLLGLGTDGHIASLFPGMPLTPAESVAAVPAQDGRCARITLTLPTLVGARRRIVLAPGAAKAPALRASLAPGAATPLGQLMAQAAVEFWLDRAAGCALCPA